MLLRTLLSSIFVLTLVSASCQSPQADAKKKAKEITETIKSTTPGAVAVSKNGFYMKATVDGKEWVATHMLPDESTSSSYERISGERGDFSISFQLWKPNVGTKLQLNEAHAADLFSEEGIFGGRKGEIIVTKFDGQWMEGEFRFTANSSMSKKIYEVTNGFFRVAVK
jgi:hypothetical protein